MFDFVGKIFFPFIFCFIVLPPKTLCKSSAKEIDNSCFNPDDNSSVEKILDRVFDISKSHNTKVFSDILKGGACETCLFGMTYLLSKIRLPDNSNFLPIFNLDHRKYLVRELKDYCYIISPVISVRVCHGLIDLNIDFLIYAIKNNKMLDASKACSILAQSFECFQESQVQWSVDIPPKSSKISNNLVIPSNKSNDFYRVLHLTDLHVDPYYKEHGSINCGEPLCCQSDQKVHLWDRINNNVAGKWGHYKKCDMPYYALENLLQQIADHNNRLDPKFSYVYFTGDIVSHRIWSTTKQSNTNEIKKVYSMFKQYFKSIPIYPILGNHEPSPLDVYSPLRVQNTTLSTTWVFDVVAKEWADFLPAEALNTVLKGGYYTILVKPGFRIVALNSNVCYIFNWWLLYDPVDPYGQLAWLAKVLLKAEENNEYVHILSHVPPGDSMCLQEWSRQFRRIVQRFSNTITGQFNGHTHFDEFRVFYDTSKKTPINVAFNGGSFTTFNDLNPNYRFYDIDSDTQEILDYEEWSYDVTEANQNPNSSPRWYKLYNFREAYNVTSLKPEDMGQLVERMEGDSSLLEKYYRFKVRNAEPSMLKKCESNNVQQLLCGIKSTEAYEAASCKPLKLETILSAI